MYLKRNIISVQAVQALISSIPTISHCYYSIADTDLFKQNVNRYAGTMFMHIFAHDITFQNIDSVTSVNYFAKILSTVKLPEYHYIIVSYNTTKSNSIWLDTQRIKQMPTLFEQCKEDLMKCQQLTAHYWLNSVFTSKFYSQYSITEALTNIKSGDAILFLNQLMTLMRCEALHVRPPVDDSPMLKLSDQALETIHHNLLNTTIFTI